MYSGSMRNAGNAGDAGMVILLIVAAVLFFLARGFLGKLEFPTVSNTPPAENGAPSGAVSTPPTGQQPSAPSSPPPPVVVPPAERAGAVIISGVNVGKKGAPSRVTIRAQLGEGESVNVTGWRVQSNKRWFPIPQAVRTYDIVRTNTEGDIVLEKGNTLTLYIGIGSPVGVNFRLNKCTGYLNDRADFPFTLPRDCPLPAADSYQNLSGTCQNYIRSLSRCESPDPEVMNAFPGDAGNACREFVNNFFGVNYCYSSLSGKADFLRNEWYAWIDEFSEVFDPSHDWVRLVNADGKTIDDYTY